MNLSRNKTCFVFFFLTSFSSVLFSFPFCLTFYFIDPLLLELVFFFFEQQFPFCKKNLFYFFYTHAFPLYVLLLIHLFICCLFFSLRFLSFSNTCVSLFLLSSVHNLSERQVYGTVANLKKTLVCLFSFLLGIFSYLFVFACFFFFFSKFLFSFYSHVFLNILLFKFAFLIVFSSVTPFFMYLFFLKTLFGLIIVFLFFFIFSFYILSLFTRRHVFLNCFRLHGLQKKKMFFLFVGP